MSKKGTKKREVKEDLEIRKVAYSKNNSNIFLLFILIFLFGLTLFCTLYFVGKYYNDDIVPPAEVIEIAKNNSKVTITNKGVIERKVMESDLDSEKIVIENINKIELQADKNSPDDLLKYNVKYVITKNDFPFNVISNNDSDVQVRFSYSFDNANWTYVNNVISTVDTNISPFMGGYYDISGISTELNIATNYTIDYNANDHITMYWKSETVIRPSKNNINNNFEANFKIEYE